MQIRKSLDVGAMGIMVPQVNDADEKPLAVQYAKYPPGDARRLPAVAPLHGRGLCGLPAARQRRETCIVVQVVQAGIDNSEAIASVDGVDVVFAGPLDLSASLGVIGQTNHPHMHEFLEAFPWRVRALQGERHHLRRPRAVQVGL